MSICFSGKIILNTTDVQRLLNPLYVFVGAHWLDNGNYINKMPDFYDRGVWELGWEREKEKYNIEIDSLNRGDILVVKRLNGIGQTTMKIIALGIVVGFPTLYDEKRTTVYVSWSIPRTDFDIPLKLIGTMGKLKELSKLEEGTLKDYIEKCRARFLSQNLQPIVHNLYQG